MELPPQLTGHVIEILGQFLELIPAVHLDPVIEIIVRNVPGAGFEGLDKLMIPMDKALENWPAVHLSENSTYYVRQGQAVQVAKAPTSGWVRLFANNDRFIGVGQILDDGRVAPKRLLNLG